ncbi:hypothetical protein MBSD_n1074 [Mizugakiibacter sediminis]|uniref:DUF1579 domain-containing protein n=1 Tax=Mizugakiibacter sediminis TaxID=1475481 RepID=A0A0K8QLP8_9GAMM|nr:DUF1579 family protein [Mizugakiibacter sediminis]GAP65783.1 hypothetical protein MBSD_n1074 [Mizugakiibacter sediminis]
MDMPQPGPAHAQLARLAGVWEGEERLAPSPWAAAGVARGRLVCRMAVDGLMLLQDYEQTRDGRVAFRAHGVMMLDPAGGDVLWWWFDSAGFPPEPARGRWDGDVLRLAKSTPRGEARYAYHAGGDRLGFAIETRLPGQDAFAAFLTGDYRRRAD